MKEWDKLVGAARSASEHGDLSAPFGFSTRLAALALAPAANLGWERMFKRICFGALTASCLLAIAVGVASYPAASRLFSDPGLMASSTETAPPATAATAQLAPAVPAPTADDAEAAGVQTPDDPVADLVAIIS